jgi:hypothetical protein
MNNTINLSINDFTFSNQRINVLDVYKSVCNQLGTYFIRTGLILICLFIFMCWFNKWFFNSGFKLISYNKSSTFGKYIGDLDNKDTRIYWDIWIRHKLSQVLVGYIAVVVYFNW